MVYIFVCPTSTFFVGLPFGFIWRRALALVDRDHDHDHDGGDDHDDHDGHGGDDHDGHGGDDDGYGEKNENH